jgi:hypothetical protein
MHTKFFAGSRPWTRAHRLAGAPVFVAALLAALAAVAQPPSRELLNSERIEAKFGSYAVEVLEADAQVRVSNLYSRDGDRKTCRTFAVVRYPPSVDPALAEEHAAIAAGGSIGAVFAQHGWAVRKSHLYFGEIAATRRLAALMHVPRGTPLAEHAYVLDVAKDGQVHEYAALVEIHHPDYLARTDLPAVYGEPSAAGRTALLKELLATAAERAAR